MTLASPPHQYTAEDLLGMPDNNHMELVNGQIVETEVSLLSTRTESRIVHVFERFMENNPVAIVCTATMGYKCFQMLAEDPGRMRKPDVSIVKMERYRNLPNRNPGYLSIFPDIAVEVVSPNDVLYEVGEKVIEYRTAGFPLVWVVDPMQQIVTVYPNPGKPFLLSQDDVIDAPNALPGFSCRVSDLFPAD